ncbi:PREDICTED: uncharacterized protein LOC107330992 isoform X1 [Acropora digitifera]|uniref:uncharacterized protein LOC107330992 isoform X1 n=1 Tax=Acropora digitifera TaxID=70779 RepID=UPI00077A5050|nr:PREDICTED: uncharacterized protein LOC107330992 isoform X1 [Acropora digitifera]
MEPREKRLLDKKLKDFMMDVVPVDLLPYLPCLTRFDKEEIEASQRNHGPTRACCVLVDRLKKRQRGFQQFLQALSQNRSHHVVWLLDPNYYTSHEGEINVTLEMQRGGDVAGDQLRGGLVASSEGPSGMAVIRRGFHQARIPTTAEITGPDQLVSTMPFRVYSRLALRLAGDRIDIASRLFNLCLEDAMALREITEHTRTLRQGVDIVFDMMIQRDVTLGQLVQVLKEMGRFDAIGLLTEAGYPDDNALGR